MCKKFVLGGLVGGLIFFIWSAASWMFLPWHMTTISTFKDEVVIKKAVTDNVSQSGVYFSPAMTHQNQAQTNQQMQPPIIFATVMLENPVSMNHMMGIGLLISIIGALFMTWIAAQAVGAGYFKRLFIVFMVALTACVTIYLPYWNWFGFPVNYTIVMFADQLIGWFIAGLVIAKAAMPKKSKA